MEPEEDKKKQLNDDVVVFMRKRSEHESPRYTARLKNYVDVQQKRRRATVARRNSEHQREKRASSKGLKGESGGNDKSPENADRQGNDDDRLSRNRGGLEKCHHVRSRSVSRSGTGGPPSDACGRSRRRRRRPCGRRRRRKRSCRRRRPRRRSRRRRRRRSCSRRRRRRSCCRRRRRRRRCRG